VGPVKVQKYFIFCKRSRERKGLIEYFLFGKLTAPNYIITRVFRTPFSAVCASIFLVGFFNINILKILKI
jgi:hypothetical protein